MTSQVLLLQHCDIIENNSIGNNAAIPLVEKFTLLMNINEWIAHVQSKQVTTRPLNDWFAQGHACEYIWFDPVSSAKRSPFRRKHFKNALTPKIILYLDRFYRYMLPTDKVTITQPHCFHDMSPNGRQTSLLTHETQFPVAYIRQRTPCHCETHCLLVAHPWE